MKTIKTETARAAAELENAGVANCVREAFLLMELALSRPASFTRAHPEYELTEAESRSFEDFVARRANREPFQHISGKQEFFGLDIFVNRHVLVPRPETELLVEESLTLIKDIERPSIWDIGTGSGCIAVSVLSERPDSVALATDISEKAIAVAKQNAAFLNVSDRIAFAVCSTTEAISEAPHFDLIVSNPPYVPQSHFGSLQREVREFDPQIALTDGADGLSIIRRIVDQAPHFLNTGGYLAMEFGFTQSKEVASMFDQRIWKQPHLENDLAGIPRIICVQIK